MQKTAYEMRISDWVSDVCSSGQAGTCAGSRGALDAAPLDAVRRRQRLPRDDHLVLGQSERQRSRNAIFPASRATPVHPLHDLFRLRNLHEPRREKGAVSRGVISTRLVLSFSLPPSCPLSLRARPILTSC